MRACYQRSASGAQRVTSGRTVSKAAPTSAACMYKADRPRRHRKERRVDGVLGIDIAKAKMQLAWLGADGKRRHKSCPNTPAGFQQLADWLQRLGGTQVHACLEATGTYGEAVATW